MAGIQRALPADSRLNDFLIKLDYQTSKNRFWADISMLEACFRIVKETLPRVTLQTASNCHIVRKINQLAIPIATILLILGLAIALAEDATASQQICEEACKINTDGEGGPWQGCKGVCEAARVAIDGCVNECSAVQAAAKFASSLMPGGEQAADAAFSACKIACGKLEVMRF